MPTVKVINFKGELIGEENLSDVVFAAPVHVPAMHQVVVAQQANAIMQRQPEGGTIIFIGSISALRPSPGTAAYGAAKAGVVSLATSLAVEWAPRVRVLTVSPGLVRTEQSHLHFGDEDGIAAVAATIPAGRLATPEDIGNACLFMASPLASYAAGANLLMNGGGERPAFLAASNTD